MKIKYRTFEDHDILGIINTITEAFATQGAVFPFTRKHFTWRYLERPGFKPEQIQIAEYDNQVVGVVIITPRSGIFLGNNYKIGGIDDVSTRVKFRRRRISKTLMENAIEYMKSEGYDGSVLNADVDYHARKRIYIPLGYKDVHKFSINIRINEFLSGVKFFSFFSIFSLIFTLAIKPIEALQRLKLNANLKFVPVDQKNIHQFIELFNKIHKKEEGFFPIDMEYFKWMVKPKFYQYYTIFHEDKLVGGIIFSYNEMLITKIFNGSKENMGRINRIFFLPEYKKYFLSNNLFINSPMKSFFQKKKCPFILFHISDNDIDKEIFRRNNHFIKIEGGVYMIKKISEDFRYNEDENAIWYTPNEHVLRDP
jgi:predicted N-acetyltransferase YhbS